jgi:16S rRNA G1207 methylase RsmC
MEILKSLKRYPQDWGKELRAWDAADELILSQNFDLKDKSILIINDSMGALSFAMADFNPTIYTDSYVSKKATLLNTQNDIEIESDLTNLKGSYDFIFIKLPKNLSFFEDQLLSISKLMHKETQLVCGAMIKHMANGHFDLINKIIGETSTSLAKKKARLIFAKKQNDITENKYPLTVNIPLWPNKITNHSNLFSREKLDIGTRFFLDNIPSGEFEKVLDLGCANGLIGLTAKKLNPNASIIFADESYMAIKSAKENYSSLFDDEATYHWGNCYSENTQKDIDLVLCNPPFHQGTTIGDFIAWQMFKDSYDCLTKGGKIRVIGNRHLGYHAKLKNIFKNSTIINQNKKFVIIDATK